MVHRVLTRSALALSLALVLMSSVAGQTPVGLGRLCGPFVEGTGSWSVIPNGGFEDGLGGWIVDGNGLGLFQLEFSDVFSDERALRGIPITSSSGPGFATRRAIIAPPGNYVMSAFVKTNGLDAGFVYLDLNDRPWEVQPSAQIGIDGWQMIWGVVTVPSGTSVVTLRIVIDSEDVCGSLDPGEVIKIDDVAFTPLTEFEFPVPVGDGSCFRWPGTNEDLRIQQSLCGFSFSEGYYPDRMTIREGAPFYLQTRTQSVFSGFPAVVVAGFHATGTPIPSVIGFPSLHFNPANVVILDTLEPLNSTESDVTTILVPNGLAGVTFTLQSIISTPFAANTYFAASEAVVIDVIP